MASFSGKTKRKLAGTIALYLSFLALGLCTAIPGPTLLDLQQIVHTSTGKVAFIYLARSSGYLFGSLIGGVLFDLIKNPELLLTICNFIMASSVLITPWSRDIETLISMLAIGGLSMGALDTGGNVFCLNIWSNNNAPFFQALHFLFGLGAVLAPLIAEPFLRNKELENDILYLLKSNESTINFTNVTNNNNVSFHFNETDGHITLSAVPSVTYAYSIIGGFALCVSFCFLIVCIMYPQKKAITKIEMVDDLPALNMTFTVIIVLIAQILLSLYCGIEIGYGQMLATFAVKGNLLLSKSIGSFLTAAFWGAFTFARGLSIYLSSKLSSFTIVFSNLVIMTLASIILLIFGNKYLEFLWGGTLMLAIGLSSFYPSVITWIDKYINVTNKIASLFVIAASLGEMVIPLIVSHYIESFPHMLMYIIFGCSISVCILTFLLWFIMTQKGQKNSSTSAIRASLNTETVCI